MPSSLVTQILPPCSSTNFFAKVNPSPPQKTLEREALLKRIRELNAEITQIERNLREREARLPIEEQLRLELRRFFQASVPELAGKVVVSARQ